MKNLVQISVLLSIVFLFSCNSKSGKENIPEHRLQWWDEAKFGLFIHWGVQAVPAGVYKDQNIESAGEWIMNRGKIPVSEYKAYASQFNPVKYDPEAWVKMAKDAGMKYIVITSKHHDGFALFDSKVTDWDVVDASPYGKDLLKPLVEACRKEGMKLGFYYSQAQDWCHPGGAASGGHWDEAQHGDFDEYLDNIAVPQVKEILSNYGDLDVLWWDTPNEMTKERTEKFLPIIAGNPNMITNNRLGIRVGEQRIVPGDFDTPEQHIPATGYPGTRWEVCMTMNNTWGYKSQDHDWKTTKDLVYKLSDIASKGGNFLLNVGPTAEGLIPQPSIERLQQIGEWMRVNGEAIYGTTASPFSYLPWGKTTRKEGKLYLHVNSWPEDGVLKLPLMNKVKKAYALKSPGSKLKIKHFSDKVEIMVPDKAPDEILSIIVLEFKGEPVIHSTPTSGKTAKASSFDPETPISNLFDNDPRNQWRAASGEISSWIEIDLGEEISIWNLNLIEPWRESHKNIQEFELQYKNGDDWNNIITGKTNGAGHSIDFNPVKGRYFRLNITGPNGNQRPALNELILNRAF